MTASSKTLTQKEVAIIRGLLERGDLKNQEILCLINTARRREQRPDVNGGRISDIKKGHPRFDGIKAAPKRDVDAFLSALQSVDERGGVMRSPTSTSVLRGLFPKSGRKNALAITETDVIECKKSFGTNHFVQNCIKAVAAFANNKGGYIVFGVEDKTWNLVGIDTTAFTQFDRRKFNQVFLNLLSCEIEFESTHLKIGRKTIGILYIHPAKTKPVMLIQQDSNAGVVTGQIYYRYHAENRLIAPAELQKIVEGRVRALSESILTKHVKTIISNGVDNSAILNLATGEVEGKAGNFILDESLLDKLSFIKEGEFVEKAGAPTLKLVGSIQDTARVIATKTEALTDRYPYSYMDLVAEIRKQHKQVTNNQINGIIKTEKIKSCTKYSDYNFRNKKQSDAFARTKRVPSGTPSIYNAAAIEFILQKLQERPETQLL